jgi:hypothetical protein
MSTPQPITPVPQSYSGTVHYQFGLALFDLGGSAGMVLLIFDSPFTGVWNFNNSAQTALYMQQHYGEGSPATLHGIVVDHLINGQQRQALHIF